VIPRFKQRPACEGTDTELWFPGDGNEYKNKETLIRICNGCPARQQCLEYALEYNVDGFWAGTTDHQRKRIRSQRKMIPKPLLPEWELRKRGA
jgi:WhiB family transcriptional regulator, redox-sensing transcriptional regulator